MSEIKNLSQNNKVFFLIIIITTMLGIFVSDIYIPSLPSIAQDFNTSDAKLATSITFYFIVFAASQLIYGPLSEKFGRRKIFLSGLIISIFGTGIVLLSKNFNMLMIGRVFEGIGMAAPMCLGRIILRDIIPDKINYTRLMSFIGIGTLSAPILAPIIGALLANFYSWRADFVFILLLSIICFITCHFFLKETLHQRKKYLSIKLVILNYIWVMKNKTFLKNMIISGTVMSAIITYLSLSSFLFQDYFKLTATQYAFLFSLGQFFIMIGMFINGVALRYISIQKIQEASLIVFLIAGILFGIQSIVFKENIKLIMIAVIIFNISAGVSFPTSTSLAIIAFKKRLGIVGSLYGCLLMMMAGTVSGLALLVPFCINKLVGLLFLTMSVIANLVMNLYKKNNH